MGDSVQLFFYCFCSFMNEESFYTANVCFTEGLSIITDEIFKRWPEH